MLHQAITGFLAPVRQMRSLVSCHATVVSHRSSTLLDSSFEGVDRASVALKQLVTPFAVH